ncbi:hypothetical protein ACTJKK_08740 [Microbacterium sp. 22179]|uniref:hypothetical protein n=1 Tax=Microbacterium sp. 22179 TaxID=3453886 RepID=UPI003F871614
MTPDERRRSADSGPVRGRFGASVLSCVDGHIRELRRLFLAPLDADDVRETAEEP